MQAVNAGDNVRAARYFAPNAVEINPEGERTALPDEATAVALNRNLQCSGRVRSVTTTRRAAHAVVELGERRKGLAPCQDVGRELRVRVIVQNGKITRLELREFVD